MAKALKTVAIIAGAAALVIATGGAAAGFGLTLATSVGGISAGALLAGSALASTASSLLTKAPKVPTAQTERLTAQVDPRAFRKTVLGQTAMPVDIRYEEWSGADQEYCDWIVCHASHAIDGLEEIWLNTEMAWSQATGVTPKFRGYFSVPNIVLEGSPANAFSFGSGRWNGSARLTGCAYSRFRFKVTGNGKKATSPFSSGIPSRITVIGRGAKLYDPRRDSTVPGGSGPMRWNDQSTWRYRTDDGVTIGENLPLHALRVVLGWRIRNPVTGEMKLATGSGVPGRRLRLESWIEAANLADELVNRSAGGQEPRYHGAGVISEGDDPGTSLEALCAACNGRFRDTSGRLSFTIAHNDLAAAAIDDGLNDDDVIGGFTWDPDPALDGTPNVVRGQYVDATTGSLYQLVDYPEVRLPSPDGQDRILTLNLGVCESASHAQRIAKQVLQRRQYQREFTAPFDIRAWKYQVGSILPFTYAPLSFNRAVFRVKAQELGQNGTCVMTLTVENAAIYQWNRDDAAPVLAAEPVPYDASRNPLVLAIADVDAQVTQILSDGVITHGREKRDLIQQWRALVAQFEALDDRFDALSQPAAVASARGEADTRLTALRNILLNLVPAWDDVDQDTPVDRDTLYAAWQAARQTLEVFAAAITGQKGDKGEKGDSAYAIISSNEAHTVAADAAGNVYDYGDASFTVAIFYGSLDVTSSFRASSIENPNDLTGFGLNSYPTVTVTGGFKASDSTARVVYNYVGKAGTAYAGVTLSTVFSLSKSRDGTAGSGGAAAPLVRVSATPQAIRYAQNGAIDSGSIVFEATLGGSAVGPVAWSSAAGHGIYNTAGVTVEGNRLTISQLRMADVLAYNLSQGNGAKETIIASASGAGDRVTVTKIQDGAVGQTGLAAKDISISPAAPTVRVGSDGNYLGGQTVSFDVVRKNLPGTTRFIIINSAGSTAFDGTAADFVAVAPAYWSTNGPDNLVLSPAGVAANTEAHGGALGKWSLRAYMAGEAPFAQSTITKVRDGDKGTNGLPGADGIGLIASPPTFVIPSYPAPGGSKPAWPGGSVRVALNKGGVEVPADNYGYFGVSNIAGLSQSGQTISFSDIIGDRGEFYVRGTRNGNTYDQRIVVTRSRDGSDAFSADASGSGGMQTGTVTFPAGKTVTISGSISYDGAIGQGSCRMRIALYWQNVTDGGGEEFLGYGPDGSTAFVSDQSTIPGEPDYQYVSGSAKHSAQFQSPNPSKLIRYTARAQVIFGNPQNLHSSVLVSSSS